MSRRVKFLPSFTEIIEGPKKIEKSLESITKIPVLGEAIQGIIASNPETEAIVQGFGVISDVEKILGSLGIDIKSKTQALDEKLYGGHSNTVANQEQRILRGLNLIPTRLPTVQFQNISSSHPTQVYEHRMAESQGGVKAS